MKLWPILALAACGDAEPRMFRVEVPVTDQDRAVIISVEMRGESTVRALPILDDRTIAPLTERFALADEVSITALIYPRTLEELELEEGVLMPELDPSRRRSLPAAERIEQVKISGGAASEWFEVELPPSLAELEVTRPDRCGSFDAELVALGMAGAPTFALALDARWVLIGTSVRRLPGGSPEVLFVDADRNVVKQSGLPSSFFDGYREDDGTLWLGGERGVVYRATFTASPSPQLSVTASSTVASREDIISLVGPKSGVPREQYALTTDRGADQEWGAFEWFDGQQWRTPGLRRNTPHDATWVAPGFALFASFFRDAQVYGIRDGAETEIEVGSVVFGSVVEIEQMPGFGLVAGTSGGEVHLMPEDGSAWRSIAAVAIQQINGVHRYPEGIVFLSGNSMIRWVDPGIVCQENVVEELGVELVRSMTVLGEDVIVPVLDAEDQLGERRLAWFRRAPR